MRDAGVAAIAVAEAFSPDDTSNELAVAALAGEVGLAVCTSTELSGLYGLELRTVTAALNASIVPIAVSTAQYVSDGVRAAGIAAPVMVMRSDGGATDLAGFSAAPVRTLYSGPSASVAGALRYTGVADAIVVEVGGTSTNIAAVRHGRPALSYVRVASHSTALRSVDVRVVGVAGGSMLRVRRGRVYGVGPRSAHIAGLPYACFAGAAVFDGAAVEVGPALPGDPADYLTLRTTGGQRYALHDDVRGQRPWHHPARGLRPCSRRGSPRRLRCGSALDAHRGRRDPPAHPGRSRGRGLRAGPAGGQVGQARPAVADRCGRRGRRPGPPGGGDARLADRDPRSGRGHLLDR
ncbi:MAG: hydantoinase/oxoprolinase family protein [Ilumatobacteraceae bacterium]